MNSNENSHQSRSKQSFISDTTKINDDRSSSCISASNMADNSASSITTTMRTMSVIMPPPPPQAPPPGGDNDDSMKILTAQDRKRMILERRRKAAAAAAAGSGNNSGNNKKRLRVSKKTTTTTTTTTDSQSSLFGLVMKHSSKNNNNKSSSTANDYNNATVSNNTQRRDGGISPPSRPTAGHSSSLLSSSPPPASPSLARVLDSIGSGFHMLDYMMADNNNSRGSLSPTASHLSSGSANNNNNQWLECDVTNGIVDWSLKRRLKMECFPSDCPPWRRRRRRGRRGQDDDDDDDDDGSHAEWINALRYSYHPSTYPLRRPTGINNNNRIDDYSSSTTLSFSTSTTKQPPSSTTNTNTHRRRRRCLPYSTPSSTSKSFWDERHREWQKAFRDLFYARYLRYLRRRTLHHSRAYFYAICKKRTILFGATEDYEPVVHCSNVPRELGGLFFHDKTTALIDDQHQHPSSSSDDDGVIKDDLADLRHPINQLPGAEINVSIAPSSSSIAETNRRRKRREEEEGRYGRLTGMDRCMEFFEWCLNRPCGGDDDDDDVPLLLTRMTLTCHDGNCCRDDDRAITVGAGNSVYFTVGEVGVLQTVDDYSQFLAERRRMDEDNRRRETGHRRRHRGNNIPNL